VTLQNQTFTDDGKRLMMMIVDGEKMKKEKGETWQSL